MKAKESIRLTINEASSECGVHRQTLAKRLKSAGIQPDADGKFTIRQIVEAHGGDYHGLRNAKLTVETKLAQLELGRQTDELWPKEVFFNLVSAYWSVQRSYLFRAPDLAAGRITSGMSPKEIADVVYKAMAETCDDLRESGHLQLLQSEHGKAAEHFLTEYEKQYGKPLTSQDEKTD